MELEWLNTPDFYCSETLFVWPLFVKVSSIWPQTSLTSSKRFDMKGFMWPVAYTVCRLPALIAKFLGPTWGPPGADRTQVGPMLAPGTLLSGYRHNGPGFNRCDIGRQRLLNLLSHPPPPGQNGRHFIDHYFKCILMNKRFFILIPIPLNFIPKGPIDN